MAALSGCAAEEPPASVSTLTATPTGEPTSEPSAVAPAQVFDGDCSRLFSEEEVGEMIGTSVTLQDVAGSDLWDQVEPQLGGMRCEWDGEYPAPTLTVLVLPSGVLTIDEQASCHVDSASGVMYCDVDSTANGIRISGAVLQPDAGGGVSLQPEADKVEALFIERATSAAAVSAPVPSATAWTSIPSCGELRSNVELQQLLLADRAFVGFVGGDGGYTYLASEVDAYFSRSDNILNCSIEGEGTYFTFSALAGGGWNEQSLAELPGAVREVVDGFDAVIIRPASFGDGRMVEAFIDDNWIETYTTSPEATYPVLRALVALFH
jgi:hypothetical protein